MMCCLHIIINTDMKLFILQLMAIHCALESDNNKPGSYTTMMKTVDKGTPLFIRLRITMVCLLVLPKVYAVYARQSIEGYNYRHIYVYLY